MIIFLVKIGGIEVLKNGATQSRETQKGKDQS